jgi:hypothetical protein
VTVTFAKDEQNQLISLLQALNIRWAKRALSLWRGDATNSDPDAIYADFESILTRDAISSSLEISDKKVRTRVRHGLIDHYLQRSLMPHEAEMQAWSRGAVAHVDGEKIRFQHVLPWCQKSSTLLKRQKLQQETGPLCKLLKPFAVNYWRILLDLLTEELGFDGYIDYCSQKKGIDYTRLYHSMKKHLLDTDALYFHLMEGWSRDRFGVSMKDLNRFDGIYLLSLSQWDALCPLEHPESTLMFFSRWGIECTHLPGLHLDVKAAAEKSSQAMTLMVQIPQEIHLLMRPEGGWIDVETLWHELGHGLSGSFTDPALSIVDRELSTTFSLSEVFAFLLQRLALSTPVLSDVMRVPQDVARTIGHYKNVKDLAVFRRYAAKFVSEYEMFTRGDVADGNAYADTMARYTGFYHQPESHLFDLVPEFYCADYLLGWLGEAMFGEQMAAQFGQDWCLSSAAGEKLKGFWRQGYAEDLFSFFEKNGFGAISAGPLRKRWSRLSSVHA